VKTNIPSKTARHLIAAIATLGLAAASVTTASAANIAISGASITGTLNANATPFTENTGNTITEVAMASAVLSAYASDTGGVWNFDTAFAAAASGDAFSLTYGASQNKTLLLTLTDTGGGLSQGNGNPVFASGAFFLASGGSVTSHTLTPDQYLQSVGIFELNRFDVGRTFTISATFLDNTTLTTGTGTGDTTYWNGFTATGTNYIKSFTITMSGSGLTRFDDLAFVVAPSAVPEPSTYAIAAGGLALVGAMVSRRRQSKN